MISPQSRIRAALAVAAVVFGLTVGLSPHNVLAAIAPVDWPTYHYDGMRAGFNAAQAPFASVSTTPTWSKTNVVTGTGTINFGNFYAEPLVVGSTVYVADENDNVFAVDAATGNYIWAQSLGASVPMSAQGGTCGNIDPLGITGTPAFDGRYLYVVAYVAPAPGNYVLFQLDTTAAGAIVWSRPLTGTGGVPGIDPVIHNQRGALAVANGRIYVPIGGRFGDCGTYHGWVVGSALNGTGPLLSYQTSTVGHGASIWSPSGISVDSGGSLYVTTGNGYGPGFPSSESVIKLSATLTQVDIWTATDWAALDAADTDLGSVGPMLIDQGLIFQSGKNGWGYLIDSARLGGVGGEVFSADVCRGGGAYGGMAYARPFIYVPCTNGLVALKFNPGSAPTFTEVWRTGFGAGPPIVAGGIVWVMGGSVLHGYEPATGTSRFTATVGSVTRFATPTAAGGRIFVAGIGSLTAYLGTAMPVVAMLPAMSNGAYGGYVTAASLQNIGTGAAVVSIRYFDTAGSPQGVGDTMTTLPVRGGWTVRQDNGQSFTAGGAGTALVYSNQPLATFVNEFAPGGGDATSYTGITGASSVLYAPAIASVGYGGYTTGIGVVNAGVSPTNLTITYRTGTGAIAATQIINGIAPNAYVGIYSGTSGSVTDAHLPSGFAGTATIQSSAGAIAAIVNEVGPGGQFSSYDAVPAGSTTLSAPVALNNAYGGYFTGMGIQNTTATAGNVTIDYFDTAGTITTKSFPITANGYLGVYQGDPTQGPAVGAYSARITSTVAVAAVVNETAPNAGAAKQSTAYNAFASGLATMNLPLVENAGSDNWSTGLGIMNTGSSTTTVTVTYYNTATGAVVATPQSLALAPNAFWGLYQPTGGLPAGTRATAVVTTSAGGQVAVVCNESNATSLMSYNGQ